MTAPDLSHFTVTSEVAEKPIHFAWTETDVSLIEPYVRDYALKMNLHFAVLEGKRLLQEPRVFSALGSLYQFPDEGKQHYRYANWDGTLDHLRSLDWLAKPTPIRTHNWGTYAGFVLFYRDPLVLFAADTYAFCILFDVFVSAAKSLGEAGIPFHMVVGPWDADDRGVNMLHVLTMREQICCVTDTTRIEREEG